MGVLYQAELRWPEFGLTWRGNKDLTSNGKLLGQAHVLQACTSVVEKSPLVPTDPSLF